MNVKTREDLVAELQSHTIEFSNWFNEASINECMGIRLNPENVVAHLRSIGPLRLRELIGALSHHKVYKEQVQTAVSAIAQTIANPGSSGVVFCEPESGKDGATFLMLFAAPIQYLKSKVSYAPLFITLSRICNLMQTRNAMRGFLNLYGEIAIISNDESERVIDQRAQSQLNISGSSAETEISLNDYALGMVEEGCPGVDILGSLVDAMTVKYESGQLARDVSSYRQRAKQRGQEVMLVVEDSQSPASTQNAKAGKRPPCPLSCLFVDIGEDFFSSVTPNFIVGFAKSPLTNVSIGNLWLVGQTRSSA